jgi:sulfopyruvate decarboxylase alpha subunit
MAGIEEWSAAVHRELAAVGVTQVAYVPDAGLSQLIQLAQTDNSMRAVPLSTEEEGVGVAIGAWLGGQRAVLMMQSSGVGNCPNMLAMAQSCRTPLLMLVTMRGDWGEFNPWQVPMGQATPEMLKLSGVIVKRVDEPELLAETVAAAARLAWGSYSMVAVLIGQRVIGAKDFMARGKQ